MNMSFMLTIEPCRRFEKTVTRRDDRTWKRLKPFDVLQQVEKSQGLKKGENIKTIHKIMVVDIRREQLGKMIAFPDYGRVECALEGFPNLTPDDFVSMYCKHNKVTPSDIVKRIEFRYLLPADGRQSLAVPPSIAVCPSCKKPLHVRPYETKQNDDGTWSSTLYDRYCESTVDIQEQSLYRGFVQSHINENSQPYIYWLPVDEKIRTWIDGTFRFEESK